MCVTLALYFWSSIFLLAFVVMFLSTVTYHMYPPVSYLVLHPVDTVKISPSREMIDTRDAASIGHRQSDGNASAVATAVDPSSFAASSRQIVKPA